jgi:hypothetical protein
MMENQTRPSCLLSTLDPQARAARRPGGTLNTETEIELAHNSFFKNSPKPPILRLPLSGPLELMLVMDPKPSKLVERLRDVVFRSPLAEEILASYYRPSR